MRTFILLFFLPLVSALSALAEDPPPVLEDSFEREELGKGWNVQFGDWKIDKGILRAKQIPADQHGAAARRVLPMGDGVFEMRFRLVDEGKAFHFGFDPARGELKKRGHLFSVIVSPGRAVLKKHVNKDDPENDPDEVLASSNFAFETGQWHLLRVAKTGNRVQATLHPEGSSTEKVELEATHPTFHVKTPTLVFRCIGDGIEVDDIVVRETTKQDSP